MDDETQALLTSLNAQREHVLGALDGLSEDVLRRALLPSGWTPLGMVQHLALDVERFWFRCAVAGEPFTPAQVRAVLERAARVRGPLGSALLSQQAYAARREL